MKPSSFLSDGFFDHLSVIRPLNPADFEQTLAKQKGLATESIHDDCSAFCILVKEGGNLVPGGIEF